MITAIAFTMYPVSNMARSRDFYERVLGLTLSCDFGNGWVEYEIGGGTFAITTMEIGRSPGAKGASIGFETEDLDIFVKALKAKSVLFVLDICETSVCHMAVIEDPDKNHIVIHRLKG